MAHLEIIVSLLSFVALIGSWFVLPAETRVTALAVAEPAASAA